MELKERQIPLSPIKHILDETQILKSLGVDSRKLKEAKKQYDRIMSHGLGSYPEVCRLVQVILIQIRNYF